MAVPKKRKSHSRSAQRRSHDGLTASYPIVCPNCGEPVLRHRACLACGQYRGKQAIPVKEETQPEAA
ncbi:MAG: 50S ribosomal protein L32 [Proteobacteria bacterium]|nr:MAG: 50S ribosomal protein L32 [Pseudomonadota bacterium]